MDQVPIVREKTDIVALISEYVPLKKSGRNFKANCPFHQENSPSFFVSFERQMFYCFGCHKGGDVFTFLMEYEHMEFAEALRHLAKKAGIQLVQTGRSAGTYSKKEELYKINRYAAEYYHYLLTSHNIGEGARKYLDERTVSVPTRKTFKIGFSPLNGTALLSYLTKKKNISQDEIIEVGLAIRIGSRVVDFFKGRIMFPLIDHRDNIVGFSGRVLSYDDQGPKYINTRDTLLYHKGENFFGFTVAKDEMRKTDSALIVEGEFDVIACFQEGITNTIALKGTALTERQVSLLSRYVTRVILSLDDDAAGQDALVRSLPLLEKKGLHVSALVIPHGKDPAEALTKDPGAFKNALKHDVPIYDYLIEKTLSKYKKKDVEGKRAIVDFLIPLFSGITNEVIREHYLRKLSKEIDTSYESLKKEEERRSRSTQEERAVIVKSEKKPREEMLEEYLLSLLIQAEKPQEASQISEEILSPHLASVRSSQKILHLLFTYFQANKLFDASLFERDLPSELSDAFSKAFLFPISTFKNESTYQKEVTTVSYELRTLILRTKLQEIAKQIKEHEKKGDEKSIEKLQEEYRLITSILVKPRL